MTEQTLEASAFEIVTFDTRSRSLDFRFRSEDGNINLRVPLGAIPKLVLGVRDQYAACVSVLPQQEWQDVQPLKYRGATPLVGSAGQKGLSMSLDIYQVPLVLTEAQATDLINALESVLSNNPSIPPLNS